MRQKSGPWSVVRGRLLVVLLFLTLATPAMAYITARLIALDGQIVLERWATASFPIRWQMNPTRGANVTGAREMGDLFRQSFQTWVNVGTATITFSEGAAAPAGTLPAADGINLITTNLTAANWATLAAGATDALGLTRVDAFASAGQIDATRRSDYAGQIIEADVYFNPNRSFSTEVTTPSDRFDLQTVAVHEIGHLLGLDHTNLLSATMFPSGATGENFGRVLSTDETLAISSLYPTAAFSARGGISGFVRTTGNAPVYGALVVAVNSSGQPVASAATDPDGRYTIAGLDAGSYTLFAEPMDLPFRQSNWQTSNATYPGFTAFTNFTTRYR